MRKGHQAVINKAIENGLSENKIMYLKREDKLVRQYPVIYKLLLNYEDDELGDFQVIDNLLAFVDLVEKELNHKRCYLVYRLNYTHVNLLAVQEIIDMNMLNLTDRLELLDWLCEGFSLVEAKETYQIWISLNRSKVYSDIMKMRDVKIRNSFDYRLKQEYAIYTCKFHEEEYFNDDYHKFIYYCLEHQIKLVIAIKSEFDFEKLKKIQLLNAFPFMEHLYGELDKDFECFFWDIDLVQKMEDFSTQLPAGMVITFDGNATKIEIKINCNSLNIKMKRYSKLYLITGEKPEVKCDNKKTTVADFVFFYTGGYYVKNKNSKLIPLLIRDIPYYINSYGKPFEKLWNELYNFLVKDSYVFKDLYPYILNHKKTSNFPPITVNECINKYNLQQLFNEKYKEGQLINWNRTNVVLAYQIYKTRSWVDEKSINKLLQYSKVKEYNEQAFIDKISTAYNPSQDLLATIIFRNLDPLSYLSDDCVESETEQYVYNIIKDYIHLCRLLKRKINLNFKSAKKVKALHDELSVLYESKCIPLIKIPKKSRFQPLQVILPKEFEWIKSRKRLIVEGQTMHHCVSSYANLINQDVCAIYSYLDEGSKERYTIEIRKKDNCFLIAQIQSKFNNGCPKEIRDYVQGLLTNKA
jgi:hypothetical protein